MQRLHRIVRILLAVLVLGGLVALLGCGGGDDDDDEDITDITASNAAFLLGGKTFTFTDIVFDMANATFAFNASATRFALLAGNNTARGAVAYGSCIFTVDASNFPVGTGPQVNQQLTADPCGLNEDADALILDDATSSSTGLVSNISF